MHLLCPIPMRFQRGMSGGDLLRTCVRAVASMPMLGYDLEANVDPDHLFAAAHGLQTRGSLGPTNLSPTMARWHPATALCESRCLIDGAMPTALHLPTAS